MNAPEGAIDHREDSAPREEPYCIIMISDPFTDEALGLGHKSRTHHSCFTIMGIPLTP